MTTIDERVAHLSLSTFKQAFDAHLAAFVSRKIASAHMHTAHAGIRRYISHAGEIARRGGKRVRPYLAHCAYSLAGGRDERMALDAWVGLELFHIFALIHDDIIDEGGERHGCETIHVMARPEGTEPALAKRIGDAQALLVGDMVFAWAQEALFDAIPQSRSAAVRTLFDRMAEEVIVGQMVDVSLMGRPVVTLEEIEEKNRLKTALYTFVNPLKIGAALAGDSREYDTFFETFGLALGSAYQIQDDLLDITGNSQKTGKETFVDLQAGQHTVFTQYIFDHGTTMQKRSLKALFGRPLDAGMRARAGALFAETGSIDAGKTRVAEDVSKAYATLDTAHLPEPHMSAFHALVELIADRAS